MRRTTLQTWIAGMLATGRSPSTARIRQQAVRRYTAWLFAAGHLDAAPFQGMTSPKLHQPVVDPLTVAELRTLLRTCQPDTTDDHAADRSLRHVRDEAIIRLMAETGIRLSEVIALAAGDLDLDAGLVTIRRGKGGRGRVIPVGPATAAAICSYLAVLKQQRHAGRKELWLGERALADRYRPGWRAAASGIVNLEKDVPDVSEDRQRVSDLFNRMLGYLEVTREVYSRVVGQHALPSWTAATPRPRVSHSTDHMGSDLFCVMIRPSVGGLLLLRTVHCGASGRRPSYEAAAQDAIPFAGGALSARALVGSGSVAVQDDLAAGLSSSGVVAQIRSRADQRDD